MMPSKEKFKEIILTLLQTKNHNCISLSNIQYAEIVKTLKRVKKSGPKSCKDYYRKNRFTLQHINGEERLIKSGTNLEFVSTDNLFDVIHQAHMITNHGRRNTMVKLLSTKYANITQEQVMVYLKLCDDCRVNQKSKVWKSFNVTAVQSPVLVPAPAVSCAFHLSL